MKKRIIAISVCFLLNIISWGFISGIAEAKPIFLKIGGGPTGALSYVTCARIADEIQRKIPNTKVSVIPGGNISNCRLVAQGELDMGWTAVNCAYFAHQGLDPYKKAYPNIRILSPCDTAILQLFAARHTDIYSYKDLYNKQVNVQRIGSNTRMAAEAVLGLYGITFDSIKKNGGVVHVLGSGAATTQMQDRNLDAMFGFGGFSPAFVRASERPGVRLIGIDPEIIEKAVAHPRLRGTFKVRLAKGVYKGCDAVVTIGIQKLLVTSEKMPDDLAYQISKIIYESQNIKDVYKGAVKKGFPQVFDIKRARLAGTIPTHPGVDKYLKERGF